MKKEEEPVSYLSKALSGFFLILICSWLFPTVIPFETFQVWGMKGGLIDWVVSAWPVVAWGAVLNLVFMLSRWDKRSHHDPEDILLPGIAISVWAGVMEEICFRWLIFYSSIVGLKISNFLFFGCLGFGVPENVYLWIVAPVANFFTAGFLHTVLYHPAGWFVGAAMLASNAFFRDGHKYQGVIGWIDAWFFGMFCFWLLFTYGLVACIVVHFLYDAGVFTMAFVEAVIKEQFVRRRSLRKAGF